MSVAATIVPADVTQAVAVRQRVSSALGQYLHPLTGGLAGTGWTSGRAVYESEVASVIEGTPGVSHVTSLRLLPNAVQRRLMIPDTPVTAAAPAGSTVLAGDRRTAVLLAEPLQPATLASSLVVTGLREGDVLACLLDLTLDHPAPPGSATFTAVPEPWPAPAGFLAGTVVLGPGGRQTQLAQPIGSRPAGSAPAPLPVVVADPGFTDGLGSGSVITLVGQFSFTVTAITQAQAGGAAGPQVLGVTTEPVAGDVAYPAGVVLGTLDGRIRLPLAEPARPDPRSGAISACTLADLQPGEQVQVYVADGGAIALTATVAALAPVEDLVYLDPDIFPYATEHQLDMIIS